MTPEGRHSSWNLTYHGITIQQHWIPYLRTAGDEQVERLAHQLDIFRSEQENLPSVEEQKGAAFILGGGGAWFATGAFNRMPGIETEDRFEGYQQALANLSNHAGPIRKNFITDPMDPVDGIGNQFFFAPPVGPYYQGRDKEEQAYRARSLANVKMFASYLHEAENANAYNFNYIWALPGTMNNTPAVVQDPDKSGFHVLNRVAEIKSNILLNTRCNAVLDRLKGYPYTRTCCTDYGVKTIHQVTIIALSLIFLTVCIVCEALDLVDCRFNPKEKCQWLGMHTGAFFMAILLCYYSDRTHLLFSKGEKNWSYLDFLLMVAPALAISIITIRKSKSPRKNANPEVLSVEENQPFLGRDQTDEWKGWMQIVILAYHWTAAAYSTGIYILIRLLVASYLFQTGYNHTTYFLKKKDFSLKRVASVLLRLNLLPCTLAFVMRTDYMFYYFSPLCSFWFLVIYATLAVGYRYNDDTQVVLAKICISAVLVSMTILATPLNSWTFFALRYIFNIQWSIFEWEYRVSLDLFIVYVGMLAAVAYLKTQEEIRAMMRWSMALVGAAVIAGFSYAAQQTDTNEYKLWHPYVSFAPILAFIALRNVSNKARNYYSVAMAWLGKCSLETYTLQFHMFLGADTYGVLLLNYFKDIPDDETILDARWKSLVVIVPVFIYVSSVTATATGNLVKLILYTPEPTDAQSTTEYTKIREANLEEQPEGEDDADVGLMGRSRADMSRYMKSMRSVKTVALSWQVRIALLLLLMWFLNLIHPMLDQSVPDGYSLYHAQAAKYG